MFHSQGFCFQYWAETLEVKLWKKVEINLQLDLMSLKVLSNLNVSVILWLILWLALLFVCFWGSRGIGKYWFLLLNMYLRHRASVSCPVISEVLLRQNESASMWSFEWEKLSQVYKPINICIFFSFQSWGKIWVLLSVWGAFTVHYNQYKMHMVHLRSV